MQYKNSRKDPRSCGSMGIPSGIYQSKNIVIKGQCPVKITQETEKRIRLAEAP